MAVEANKAGDDQSKNTNAGQGGAADGSQTGADAGADAGKGKDGVADQKAGQVADAGAAGQSGKPAKSPELVVAEELIVDIKRENKSLANDMKKLLEAVQQGQGAKQTNATIDAIKKKYTDVNPEFIDELTQAIETAVEAKAEAKVAPMRERESNLQKDKKFDELYEAVMTELPDFAAVADKDAVRALVENPKNAQKTIREILESAYGKALGGKRTLEPTRPRGGGANSKVDVEKAQRDPAYYREVMADPDMKKQYNEGLTKRLQSHLG